MAKLIVVGAGTMGLAAAFHAAKTGHSVEVLEAAPEIGGMAAHFDLDGLSIERFYHFVCKSDVSTFKLLNELGIGDRLRWRRTSMGYFMGNRLHSWGNPVALLKFPEINLLSRIRYGFFAFVSTRRDRWDALESQTARVWITRWCGNDVYDRLWAPLLKYKFYQHADHISAAWLWTRIRRVGRSRRTFSGEELGYIEGGSQTLVDALCAGIKTAGGNIRVSCPARRILAKDGVVTGVETSEGFVQGDAVICTVPAALISKLVPDLPQTTKAAYDKINYMGVCCLVFKLRRSVTPHFWVNVAVRGIEVPGFVEFSNLRDVGGNTIVYFPYYLPTDHPKFGWDEEDLLSEAFECLVRVNPAITRYDIIAAHVSRLRYAQPVCTPGFARRLPPVQTAITALQIADTSFYYPEDRGISESVRFGREMAQRIGTPNPATGKHSRTRDRDVSPERNKLHEGGLNPDDLK